MLVALSSTSTAWAYGSFTPTGLSNNTVTVKASLPSSSKSSGIGYKVVPGSNSQAVYYADDGNGFEESCQGVHFINGKNGVNIQGDGAHIGVTNVSLFAEMYPTIFSTLEHSNVYTDSGQLIHYYNDACAIDITLDQAIVPAQTYKFKISLVTPYSSKNKASSKVRTVFGTGSQKNDWYCPLTNPIVGVPDNEAQKWILTKNSGDIDKVIKFGCAGIYKITLTNNLTKQVTTFRHTVLAEGNVIPSVNGSKTVLTYAPSGDYYPPGNNSNSNQNGNNSNSNGSNGQGSGANQGGYDTWISNGGNIFPVPYNGNNGN